MNSRNSETSYSHNLKETDKHVALPNLSIYYTWKNIKKVI